MSKLEFNGRVAVVTGAGRGLGRAYAELLAARGASVVVNDIGGDLAGNGGDSAFASEVADHIVRAGGKAVPNFDPVGTAEAAKSMIGQAIDTFGRIDILINNAGNFMPLHPFSESTTESFERIYAVHVTGAVHLIRAAWPHMAAQHYGKIVNTGSGGGYYATPGRAEYCTAKAALHGLTRALSHESLEHGIHINLIVPGALTRGGVERAGPEKAAVLGPILGAELVAPIVAWLCHEDCQANGDSFMSMAGTTTQIKIAETRGFGQDTLTVEDIRDRFNEVCCPEQLNASALTFWDNAEEQGAEMVARFGNRGQGVG